MRICDCGAAAAALGVILATTAMAEPMRSQVAINTGDQTPAAEQPADGVAVDYPVTLSGGALDGCTMQVQEQLFPREDGAWGIFRVASDVACAEGGFRFTSAGAWDAGAFHGAGQVEEGSGTGTYDGIAARIAQVGGSVQPAADGKTLDVAYVLIVDPLTR